MNTVNLSNHSIAGLPTPGRRLKAYLEETRSEALRLLRNPGLIFPVLIMPAGLYALIALVVAGEAIDKDPVTGTFLFTAFAVMAISMTAVYGLSSSLAMEREMGLLQLKRAQPAPAGSWLVAKILCGVAFGALALLPVVGLAVGSGKLQLAPGQLVAMVPALLLCSIPFCAMGLMMGALVKGSAAAGYANLVYLPGCYLSGMFFPLPASLYWQAPIWPQFHVIQVIMHAGGIEKFQFEPLAVAGGTLLGYTALFSAVSLWRLARRG